jgi:hypothetical protein
MPGATPPDPHIFHITHVDNLASIVQEGCLWSDMHRQQRQLASTNIGYGHIKARRMRRAVPVAARGVLGQYVPFYFCCRSVMLYVIHRRHEDYQGGQGPIVHLVSRISRATATGHRWAFTDRHAELQYAQYYDDLSQLGQVDWSVMPHGIFWGGDPDMKERRQAEFLVYEAFPWTAIERIVVKDAAIATKTLSAMQQAAYQPPVDVNPDWYY